MFRIRPNAQLRRLKLGLLELELVLSVILYLWNRAYQVFDCLELGLTPNLQGVMILVSTPARVLQIHIDIRTVLLFPTNNNPCVP